MLKSKKIWFATLAAIFGFFWSYSFSTRINLLFIIPLWLKIIVLGGLTLNFSLLAHHLGIEFIRRITQPKWRIYLVAGAVFLSALIFLLVPYQRVPFRTTHDLKITAEDAEVKLKAVLSPDDNLISRDQFSSEGQVEPFAKMGFRLPPGGSLIYQRAQTGGLTLSFTIDSAPVKIVWDGQAQIIKPDQLDLSGQKTALRWRFSSDVASNTFNIHLPGNTWGQPDTFWATLGALLPISDFVTLGTIITFLLWLALRILNKETITFPNARLVRYWLDALIVTAMAMVFIKVGFPNFIPFWFLLFFIPATLYLAYHQTAMLTLINEIHFPCFPKIQAFVEKSRKVLTTYNRNRWLFWVMLTIVTLIGGAVQTHLTKPGMGISGDSVHYLQGAENLVNGKGYVLHIAEGDPEPITGFEPAYSMLVAIGIRLGSTAEHAARILNLVLFCFSIVLTGWIIFQITGKVMPAFLGSSFLVMAPNTMSIFAWVMSESLFIVLLLAIILAWYRYIQTPTAWKAFLVGVFSAFMMATRLAGAVFLPPLAITMLMIKKQRFGKRVRDVFIFGFTSILAPGAFLIRNRLVTPSSPPSEAGPLVPFSSEYWNILGSEIASWFKWQTFFNLEHQRFNALFASLGFILILFILWLIFQKDLPTEKHPRTIMVVLFVFPPIYILAIILNTILFTPDQTVYGLSRYLIPIYIILLIFICALLSVYWKRRELFPKILILFLCLVSLQIYFEEFVDVLEKQPRLYRQYTDRNHDCGDEIRAIVNSQPENSIYTNNCEYFFFTTGRQCRHLPSDGNLSQPNSEIYQAVKAGDWVAFSEEFGTNPPGIDYFLGSLERFDSACYFDFYR
jgi:hypothetical protein